MRRDNCASDIVEWAWTEMRRKKFQKRGAVIFLSSDARILFYFFFFAEKIKGLWKEGVDLF